MNRFASKVPNVETRSHDTARHFSAALSWSTIERVKHRSGLPLVVKALALGADAVGIGRLQAPALACGGKGALIHASEILEYEMTVTFGLLGVSDVRQLSPEPVVPGTRVENLSVLSAFPVASQRLGM